MIEMMVAPQRGAEIRPNQARWMYAADKSEMNSRSPRVVEMPRAPGVRGSPPGRKYS